MFIYTLFTTQNNTETMKMNSSHGKYRILYQILFLPTNIHIAYIAYILYIFSDNIHVLLWKFLGSSHDNLEQYLGNNTYFTWMILYLCKNEWIFNFFIGSYTTNLIFLSTRFSRKLDVGSNS